MCLLLSQEQPKGVFNHRTDSAALLGSQFLNFRLQRLIYCHRSTHKCILASAMIIKMHLDVTGQIVAQVLAQLFVRVTFNSGQVVSG